MPDTCRIEVFRDGDSGVWWCTSEDIPGLVSEAPTFDALVDRVTAVVPDLLEANGELRSVTLEFNARAIAYA